MEQETQVQQADYSTNRLVLWVLVILTLGEFYLGASSGGRASAFLIVFALIKAGFIIANYMNLGRVFGRGEGHE